MKSVRDELVWIVVSLVTCAICGVVAFSAGTKRGQRAAEEDRVVQRSEEEARRDEARIALNKLNQEIDSVRQRHVEAMRDDFERDLQQLFPGAKRLVSNELVIEQGVVSRVTLQFTKTDGEAFIRYENKEQASAQPDVKIILLNRYGVVTATIRDVWTFDSVKSGEVRSEKKQFRLEWGEPKYWVFGPGD